jgi:flagellar hook assembly protein FlgD
MSFRRTLALVLATAALAPGTAGAADVQVVARDVPLAAARGSVPRAAPIEFTMVGTHWQGGGEVWFRTANEFGAWSVWRLARPEDEDLPDATSDEGAASRSWNVGNPWWTGGSTSIQYRVSGPVTRLRTFYISSEPTPADATFAAPATQATLRPDQPPITRRPGWGADESIVRASPSFADTLELSVVHHTAGTNSYSASQSAAIVRGIQRYHVLSNGWNDIGYNYLVDKYGRIFEGRRGGLIQNVIGAHAQGFNTGSVGVAVLGTYGSARISTAARNALQRLLAWRLDAGHVDPVSLLNFTSYGNDRFPAGRVVRLRAVSGHRDTGYTSCPGTALYGQLGAIASNVSRIGLPKLYDPEVDGGVGGPVRFTARLSSARAWLVQVKDAGGSVVAQGTGSGTAVSWTWDASAVPIASYTYVISAGPDTRAATGPVPGPPPLAITGLSVKPPALTPNGDWSGERSTVSFRLSRRAIVAVRVVNASSGALARTLLASAERPAGPRSVSWDGTTGSGAAAAEGTYRVEVSAESGPEQVTRSANVVLDRTLGGMTVAPLLVSPTGDGQNERMRIGFELTRTASVRVAINRAGKTIRTLLTGSLAAGAYAATWDGRLANGARAPDGPVSAAVIATTSLGTRSLALAGRVDSTRPVLRFVSLRNANGIARLVFDVSEPVSLKIWYGTNHWSDGDMVEVDRPAGARQQFWRRVGAQVVRMLAVDAAGNRSRLVFGRAG